MINIDEFKTIIAERERLSKETQDEWEYGIDKCRDKLISLLTSDIFATNEFLKTECTAAQFSWMSEIFDEIVEKTKSREFIAALRKVAKKFPEECEKYNIIYFIDEAEELLEYLENENQTGLDEN